MTSEEFFKKALNTVSEVTGIPELAILKSNVRSHADARYVLVCALTPVMTDAEIGSYLGRTPQGIGFIRRSVRSSRMVEFNRKEVCKRLESAFFHS